MRSNQLNISGYSPDKNVLGYIQIRTVVLLSDLMRIIENRYLHIVLLNIPQQQEVLLH